MTKGRRTGTLVFAIGVLVLTGCAVPATKSEVTPGFRGIPTEKLGLSIIDKRPYVVSGDKDAKFEGLSRSGYGIPWTIDRPNRPDEETFADFLAGMLKDGFTDAGSQVVIWRLPVGSSLQDVIKEMPSGVDKALVILMYESKWDQGGAFRFSYSYEHDFYLYVVDSAGKILVEKRFSGTETNELSDKYNAWDMHQVNYKKHFEQFLTDETIKNELLFSPVSPKAL